jgi:magnesium-transporting ATPase (P-type)
VSHPKALTQHLAREVIVLRAGGGETLPARELVLGDIVKLRISDIVPDLVYTQQCD